MDDGYLIAGDKQPKANLSDHKVFVMRTDRQGNKRWEKWFGIAGRGSALSDMIMLNNNEFVLGYTSNNFYEPMSQWNWGAKILAIDTLGDIKWEQPMFSNGSGAAGLQA